MPKRFTGTEIWEKEWFMNLSCKHKCLIRFIYDKCDASGVWVANWKLVSLYIGEEIKPEDMEILKEHVEMIKPGKYFVNDFISFQYGKLSEACTPHKPVFALLQKHGLLERVSKGYQKGIDTLVEKEKDKDKDKDKEKDKEENINKILTQWNNYAQKNKLPKIVELSKSRKDKLEARLKRPNFNFEAILAAAQKQPFLFGENERRWKLNFDFIVENDSNYLGILEFKYGYDEKSAFLARDECRYCGGTGETSAMLEGISVLVPCCCNAGDKKAEEKGFRWNGRTSVFSCKGNTYEKYL